MSQNDVYGVFTLPNTKTDTVTETDTNTDNLAQNPWFYTTHILSVSLLGAVWTHPICEQYLHQSLHLKVGLVIVKLP